MTRKRSTDESPGEKEPAKKRAARGGLDAKIKAEITAIVGTGCSLETAAKYAGCLVSEIRKEIRRDTVFAAELRRGEEAAEIYFLQQIKRAAKKEQYWRAAAWALERKIPGRYASRSAGTLTVTEIREIFQRLAEIVLAEVSQKEDRRKIIGRVEKLLVEISAGTLETGGISGGKKRKEEDDEDSD